MSAIYWTDFDCDRASRQIEYSDVIHEHCDYERDACQAYIRMKHSKGEARYRCIRGPGGLVRGVLDRGCRLYAVTDFEAVQELRRALNVILGPLTIDT